MCNLMEIPVEVQEMILSNLTLLDLYSMSKVCRLWFGMCAWIAKEKFSKIIPEECIEEIEDSGVPQEEVWLTAIKYHYLQKCLSSQMLNQSKYVIAELNDEDYCFCNYESLVFVGSVCGELNVYDREKGDEPVLQMKFENTKILQLEVMPVMNVLLMRSLVNEVTFLSLPFHTGKGWVYQMTSLKPKISNFDGKLFAERNFSVSGAVFALVTDHLQVCLFQVMSVTKESVELKFLTNYLTEDSIGRVSLWRDEVIIVFKMGRILRWCLTTLHSFLSPRYYELEYENPCWISRGRIFCSTVVSSELLGYWHMDRGAQYWLTGKPARELVRCRDLGATLSNNLNGEYILCVCLKQRLLACGTSNGKVLIYYLSDICFSSDDFDLNGNSNLTQEFHRPPDLIIQTKERPISNLRIHFDENSITICTWPCRMLNRPELRGLLQCIVLKEIKKIE